MSDLDEVSKMMGGLQSDMKHLQSDMKHVRRTNEKILEKTDKINDTVIIQGQQIKAAHSRLDDVEPKVAEHENIKNKGIGFWFALTTIISSVSGVIGSLVTKVWF